MEIGVYSFAEMTPNVVTGEKITAHQRIRNLMEEIELAEQVGLDMFAIGEHHRPEFAVSAPAVVLAAAAERTKKIKLSSAVTVFSSDDPVRVYQNFATVDLLSGGGLKSWLAEVRLSNLFLFLAMTWKTMMNCFQKN